jgi:hypothetical protein
MSGDVFGLAERGSLAGAPFRLVVLDPPYAVDAERVSSLVASLAERGMLREGALVLYEHDSHAPGLDVADFTQIKEKSHGITTVELLRRNAALAEAEVIHYDDVDFTALDKALTAFEALSEADYTADSWHAAKNFYDAAVAMKDGTYPQNAVTVAAWKLEDSIKELAPAPKAEKADTPAAKNSRLKLPELKSIKMDKGIVAVAIATLAGAVTGAVAGVITSLKKKN